MMPKSEKSEESLNQSSALSGDLSLEQESFHRTEELEDLHSSYSRYFLHYGIKSAALVMFADEILSILKTGNSDITPVTEKFKILTEPLGISMTPLKTILPVPDRAFSISTSYWGSLGSQEPDRLKILPSDFMSVLGGGIIGRPEVVPSKVLQINWQLRDLRNSAQVGALIKVAHSLWQKCLSKLELPEFAWSRDSAKAAQIQLVSAFFERIVRDPSNAYYLEKGQSFLDSFREPIGGKVGGPADGKSRKS